MDIAIDRKKLYVPAAAGLYEACAPLGYTLIRVALGLFTQAVALAFVMEMAVICFAVLWPNWSWGHRGMEYALFVGIVALAICFRGGRAWSLGSAMKKEF